MFTEKIGRGEEQAGEDGDRRASERETREGGAEGKGTPKAEERKKDRGGRAGEGGRDGGGENDGGKKMGTKRRGRERKGGEARKEERTEDEKGRRNLGADGREAREETKVGGEEEDQRQKEEGDPETAWEHPKGRERGNTATLRNQREDGSRRLRGKMLFLDPLIVK